MDVPAVIDELQDEEILVADAVTMSERLVVAPCMGRFEPLAPELFTTEGEWVEPGQVLASIDTGVGRGVEVASAFRGWVMGMMALKGQPVHRGTALFWIRCC